MAKPAHVLQQAKVDTKTALHEIEKLRSQLLVLARRNDYLQAQLSEVALQAVYIMKMVEVTRPALPSALIFPGQPPRNEVGTLYDFYRRERVPFLAEIEKANAQAHAEAAARRQPSPEVEAFTDAVAQVAPHGSNGHASDGRITPA